MSETSDMPKKTRVSADLNVDTLFVRTRYRELMEAARALAEERPEPAVVMAQAALEVYTDQALSVLLERRGLSRLRLPHDSSNLANERVRTFWEVLTGDAINQQPLIWQAFMKHVQRRNNVIHKGHRASVQDARNSVGACTTVIQHLQGVLRPMLAETRES